MPRHTMTVRAAAGTRGIWPASRLTNPKARQQKDQGPPAPALRCAPADQQRGAQQCTAALPASGFQSAACRGAALYLLRPRQLRVSGCTGLDPLADEDGVWLSSASVCSSNPNAYDLSTSTSDIVVITEVIFGWAVRLHVTLCGAGSVPSLFHHVFWRIDG